MSAAYIYRANPGSEFIVANILAKWKKSYEIDFSQVFNLGKQYQEVVLYLTLCPLEELFLSSDNLCKQFGSWSGLTKLRPDILSGLILIQTVWHPDGIERKSIQRFKFGTIVKCQGKIKSILENPKADQNILFRR